MPDANRFSQAGVLLWVWTIAVFLLSRYNKTMVKKFEKGQTDYEMPFHYYAKLS